MKSADLDRIFRPASTAVIGASRRPEAVGHAVFRNLLTSGYEGVVYPVNPKTGSILGVRCYPSVLDIPDPVDLAVLIVPAAAAAETFRQCARKGVRGAILISAGFKETGPEGALMEEELAALSARFQIPLIGPNCLGVINTDPAVRLNASFARSMPRPGRFAFLSQSGALCTAVLDYAKGSGIGFSKFVSLGNKANITELELLEYLARDDATEVILMYIEDLSRPREMIDLCRQISGEGGRGSKPILAIKSGRTLAGAKAASSHTGSLAGSDEVYTSLFAQGGILRVGSVEELFDYAAAFSTGKLPKRNRVAIVTNAGGPGIMATDACVREGLEVVPLSEKTRAQLKAVLPPAANTTNPVDVIGDARHDRYEAALKTVLKEPRVDASIVILTPQAMTDIEQIARVIGRAARRSAKPVLACFMGVVDISAGERVLEELGVPHYRFPESAAQALAAMARYTAWVKRPRTGVRRFAVERKKAASILRAAAGRGETVLPASETTALLAAYGFPVLKSESAADPKSARAAAERLGLPVALKVSSPDILHKIDVGGVRLNLETAQAVEEAARQILAGIRKKLPSARIQGVIVQKMAAPGREVILGFKRDPAFGPILMFGLGGTYVEVFKDVTFRIAPIRELGARNMIQAIRGRPILEGVRGQKPADLATLEECLERLSQLSLECPEISELDINPLRVYERGRGCTVVDARILLQRRAAHAIVHEAGFPLHPQQAPLR